MPSDFPFTNLLLTPEVLRENDPDPKRVLFWLKGDRRERFQYWERISGLLVEPGAAGQGLATMPVRVAPFRQKMGGDLGKVFSRFWGGNGKPEAGYILPTGEWAEPTGQAREDALLVWTSESEERPQPAAIDEAWPGKENCKQLGPRLFLVVGVPAPPALRPAPANGHGKPPAPFLAHESALLLQRNPPIPPTAVDITPVEPGAPGSPLSDRDVQHWLQTRSRQVSKHGEEGQWPLAVELAQEMLSWIRRQRGAEHPQVATCLNQLGRVHQLQGDAVSAEPFYREALRMNGRLLGIGHPSFATGLNNLALLYQALGNLAGAEELHRQALEIRLACLGDSHPLVATSQNNIGLMHLAAGNPQAAEPLLTHAVEAIRSALGPEHPDLAVCLHNLAAVCRCLGECVRADQLADQAQRIREIARDRDYLRIADSLNILAEHTTPAVQVDEPVAPVEPAEASVAMMQSVVGADTAEQPSSPPSEIPIIAQLPSDLYSETEDLLPSECYSEVLDLSALEVVASSELWEPESSIEITAPPADQTCPVPDVAEILAETVAPPTGPAPTDVSTEVVEEAASQESVEPDQINWVVEEGENVNFWEDMVVAPEEPGFVSEIVPITEVAVVVEVPEAEKIDLAEPMAPPDPIVEPPQPPADQAVEEPPSYVPDGMSTPAELIRLADQHRAAGEFQPAEALYRRALDTGRSATDSTRPYFAHLAQGLNGLALTCAATGRPAEALELLRQVLGVDAALLAAALEPGGEDRRGIRLFWVRADLNAILSLVWQRLAHSPEAARAALDAVFRYKGIAGAARADSPEVQIELQDHLEPAGRSDVAHALPSDSALVEFVRLPVLDFQASSGRAGDHWKPARYLAFVLPAGEPDNVRLIDLGEADSIDNTIAAFRVSITGEGVKVREPLRATIPPIASPTPDLAAGMALRQAVFDPLAGALAGRTRLFLAPAGNLASLPWEVLPDKEDGYLIDTYRIGYLTSGRDVLYFGSNGEGQATAPVVAADPDYDLGLPSQNAAVPTPSAWLVGLEPGDPATLFPRLAGARRGAKAIAELLGVEPHLAGSVRKGILQAVRSPGILHLATHCFFSNAEPAHEGTSSFEVDTVKPWAEAGLALAGANRQGRDRVLPSLGKQGFLTAEEIVGLDLAATELVVLPACAAGPADGKIGAKLVALRNAFMLAGAQTLVMSQWKVPDWHAKVLLLDFYARLLDGEPRGEALRNAQLALRAQYPQQPSCWGAFICHGDPGPLLGRARPGKNR